MTPTVGHSSGKAVTKLISIAPSLLCVTSNLQSEGLKKANQFLFLFPVTLLPLKEKNLIRIRFVESQPAAVQPCDLE